MRKFPQNRGQARLPTPEARGNSGQALLIAVIFFVVISTVIISSIAVPILRGYTQSKSYISSKIAYYASESGLEDMHYRFVEGFKTSSTETVVLGGYNVQVEINDLAGGQKEIISTGDIGSRVRRNKIIMRVGEGATFNFGVQSDTGGILMENSSSIIGNAFSNGEIRGSGGNEVSGGAISAGQAGLISRIHVADSAYARTITNSTIDGDAYYQNISGTTVGGVSYPGSEDQATSTMPLTDEQIDNLKADAEAGGVTECAGTLVINSDAVIGPQRYTCNVEIRNNPNITLAGAIWIEGNLDFSNSPSFFIESSLALEGKSIPIIADNEIDRITSGIISFKNSGYFDGGGKGGYVMLISQNESAETGGTNAAISVENGATGDVLVYAAHGEVLLRNNVDLKEVTAYKVRLQNSAQVIYETGLVNVNFTTGPGASFSLDSWEEIE